MVKAGCYSDWRKKDNIEERQYENKFVAAATF